MHLCAVITMGFIVITCNATFQDLPVQHITMRCRDISFPVTFICAVIMYFVAWHCSCYVVTMCIIFHYAHLCVWKIVLVLMAMNSACRCKCIITIISLCGTVVLEHVSAIFGLIDWWTMQFVCLGKSDGTSIVVLSFITGYYTHMLPLDCVH